MVTSENNNQPKIVSVDDLLDGKIFTEQTVNMAIPSYQRPYKWTSKNIIDLILDIQKSIEDSHIYKNFKYRIGTIILHKTKKDDAVVFEIVDGQQRILSLLLLKLFLCNEQQRDKQNSEKESIESGKHNFTCYLLENSKFSNKESQKNLHDNYITIRDWFSSVSDRLPFIKALENILEVVVITVEKIEEAFQLFDSQNSRGRALYPHDLLKAYHLREIHDKYDMQDAVVKWESKDPKSIRQLFDGYLFPIWNWTQHKKSGRFTTADIDIYKGINESSDYTYARRANKAMPHFQLTAPFISGKDFFEMVDHYMRMLHNIKEEISTNSVFDGIKSGVILKEIENDGKKIKLSGAGFNYACNLFFCALLCYYDRFHNFDERAVKKIFYWAMMIRLDMQTLGFGTINKYAISERSNDKYSNYIPMFSKIAYARKHTEISGININIRLNTDKWNELYKQLCELNGIEIKNDK